jgi:hypothetical protein
MSPTLAIQFSAAADGRQLTADVDTVLTAVSSPAAAKIVVVSKDKATTIANSVTGPSNVSDENILAIAAGFQAICRVPISAGQSVFVSASAAMSAVLSFEDVV